VGGELLNFRPATPADVPLLRRWDEQPHVVASDPDSDWMWEETLANPRDWREQWIAEVEGCPIGYLQILDPARDEEQYWGAVAPGFRALDIWIGEPDAVGKSHGTAMMRWAIDRCFADPSVHTILLDPLAANARAHRFYERLGFRFVERRHFGSDDCYVYRLTREGFVSSRAEAS
jgi:aminoglycoside 6'-N-acetyltransferase